MGLLCKILKLFFRFVTKLILNSLTDDPYGNQEVIFLANTVTIFAWLFGFGFALYLLIWAVSLKILLTALLVAYLAAFGWSKLCRHLSASSQEAYLLSSTVGLTVIFGTAIQLYRMPSADGRTLLVYWIILLLFGFALWLITLINIPTATEVERFLTSKPIVYKRRFRTTEISRETPAANAVQAYLKNMK